MTVEPRRTPFKPRNGLPDENAQVKHWEKHPSDYYADTAVGHMLASWDEQDTQRRQNTLREAQVCASLSLRDAVLELRSTLKESIQQLIDHLPKEN